MFQHHLYSEKYPEIKEESNEFDILSNYLCLNYDHQTLTETTKSAITLLNWSCDDTKVLIQTWCKEFMFFVTKSLFSSRVIKFIFQF